MALDQLPLQRDQDGGLVMAGHGPCYLRIDYASVLAREDEGVTFMGYVDGIDGRLIKQVALKMHKVVQDPRDILRTEAGVHVNAWVKLGHVISPLGYLKAHDQTGTPAMLVLELAMPFCVFLDVAGPVHQRQDEETKAVARIVGQLLRFVVAGDLIRMMHREIKMDCMYVRKGDTMECAELAMGGFRSAQHGSVDADGNITYRVGGNLWDQPSPRMSSMIYSEMVSRAVHRDDLELDRQLVFYDDLFWWARVAFQALTGRPPPDMLYGPTSQDHEQVPGEGNGDVVEAIRHMLEFALELLGTGHLSGVVDSEYVQSLHWYKSLPAVLAGNAPR